MTPEPPEPTPDQALVTHVRASTLGGLFREIDARGPELRLSLVGSLSPGAQMAFRESPGAFQWIETPLVCELVAAYEGRYGLEDIERRVEYTAKQQLTVIHGWMMKLLTPETVFHQAATLYRFNFRGGVARAEEVQPGRAVVSLWSHGLYPSWYTHAFPGWLAGALRTIGADSPRVTHRPAGAGYHHGYEVTWSR